MDIEYEIISTKLNEILYKLLYPSICTMSYQETQNVSNKLKNWKQLILNIEEELNKESF